MRFFTCLFSMLSLLLATAAQAEEGDGYARLDWLRKYAEGETATLLDGRTKIDGYAYDWSLNEAE